MSLIQVQNLTFEYPGHRALNDVSFTIEEGTVTALVGPNGAGKTTLMNCLAALDQPVLGRIQVEGISVLDEPRKCHEVIGYLPDFFGLYEELTVEQCLAYMAMAQGIPLSQTGQAIQKTAQRVQLLKRLGQKAGELSRGLRQRLAIGQAIIHDPKIILLDEPASGLDPEARFHLSELIVELHQLGKSLLVSSHILSELEDYSTHIMVIKDGELKEHSSIQKNGSLSENKMVITLSHPIDRFEEYLQSIESIQQLHIKPTQATFKFKGNLEDQHQLLRKLLNIGLPVCSFEVRNKNLQESYLEKFGGELHD